jgi:pyruvate-formate lyase
MDCSHIWSNQSLIIFTAFDSSQNPSAAARDPVRELECAALEAGRRAAGMSLMAATQRRGPEPSAAEVAEALQDAWCGQQIAS